MAAFWDTAASNLLVVDRRFRGAYCLHQVRMMEAVNIYETLVNFYKTTRQDNLKHIQLINLSVFDLTYYLYYLNTCVF
jgi:hypothetical protein